MRLSPTAVLGWHPAIEVTARRAYWSNPRLHARMGRSRPLGRPPVDEPAKPTEVLHLTEALRTLEIGPGDALIVHSGNDALAELGLHPHALNDALLQIVEPDGIVAMPAYPILRDEPTGFEYMHPHAPLPTMRFDVRKTPPWTGVLGLDLMRRANAVRSRLPINTLTAVGSRADTLFARELDSDIPHACGRGSAWEALVLRNAKVLAIGVDLAHSLTLNHVAEDLDPQGWPVRDWYRLRRFETTTRDSTIRGQMWERRPRWAQYYAERTLARDLVRDGVARSVSVNGTEIQMLHARDHLDYLRSRGTTYPYFYIPRKYRRSRR